MNAIGVYLAGLWAGLLVVLSLTYGLLAVPLAVQFWAWGVLLMAAVFVLSFMSAVAALVRLWSWWRLGRPYGLAGLVSWP